MNIQKYKRIDLQWNSSSKGCMVKRTKAEEGARGNYGGRNPSDDKLQRRT